jgi:hypothetical protein
MYIKDHFMKKFEDWEVKNNVVYNRLIAKEKSKFD